MEQGCWSEAAIEDEMRYEVRVEIEERNTCA